LSHDPNTDLAHLLEQATAHQSAGRWRHAEAAYRQLLQEAGEHPDLLHLLAVTVDQDGRPDEAVPLLQRAIAQAPAHAEYHDSLGNALRGLGSFDQAEKAHRQAVALEPHAPDWVNNLGVTLQAAGRKRDALVAYEAALALNPGLAGAHENRGVLLTETDRPADALGSLKTALTLQPDSSTAHDNLGLALARLGLLEQAESNHERATALDPSNWKAHLNRGAALKALGRAEEAVASYQRAAQGAPHRAEVHNNLGNALRELGLLDAAMNCYRRAVEVAPRFTEAHNNLGVILQNCGRLDEALEAFERARALDVDFTGAWRNLLTTKLYTSDSPTHLKAAFAERVAFAHRFGVSPQKPPPRPALSTTPQASRRLRVGYVSSDLRQHPVGRNLWALFAHRTRADFELFAYADVASPDALTQAYRHEADGWRDIVGQSDAEVARIIRADEIDILVIVAGHFDANRPLLGNGRAAPVQVSLHDAATSGSRETDYFLTDAVLNPEDTPEPFSEALHRLPIFYNFPAPEGTPAVGPPPSESAGTLTFGCFNNPAKLTTNQIEIFCRILRAVPRSTLVLKYKNWFRQPGVAQHFADRFTAFGIAPERVVFTETQGGLHEHLARYNTIDIALDTYPFTGLSTTFDALWMGVPVVTRVGSTCVSRASAALLQPLGLGNLVTNTPDNYVACVTQLAQDADQRARLRRSLRDSVRRSPLCDGPAYAQSVERAYQLFWRRLTEGPG